MYGDDPVFAIAQSAACSASCSRPTQSQLTPASHNTSDELIDHVQAWCLVQDPELPLWLSDSAQDFLSNMLLKDPSRRSTAAQLLKHPWLKALGFKPPVDLIPSSVEVVEPVLPPRPAVAAAAEPQVEPVVTTEATVTVTEEEPTVEEETIKAIVPEVEASTAGKKASSAMT